MCCSDGSNKEKCRKNKMFVDTYLEFYLCKQATRAQLRMLDACRGGAWLKDTSAGPGR